MKDRKDRYSKIIEEVFKLVYQEGVTELDFERTDINRAAERLKIKLPKNLGDVIYSFRYRTSFPPQITKMTPKGHEWIIRLAGRGRYKFVLVRKIDISPDDKLVETKIPDATPGIIARYAMTDEQALLARLRYNRLIDIFTGITCYSLQNHLRTTVPNIGQVETDEIYVGIDKRGVHYILPAQAKGGKDKLGVVQIEQDTALCAAKFPALVCRPIAAQFMREDLIALFELQETEDGIRVLTEKHYKLVNPDELSPAELESYRTRQS